MYFCTDRNTDLYVSLVFSDMVLDELKRIKKIERKFSRHKYNGSKKAGFVIVPGRIPLMISAPHAINHFREGQLKCADRFTGSIAILLHQLTGCHIIYSSGYFNGDPNYDNLNSNPYQQALIEYLKEHNIPVLIDLHGASESRPYAVEIGTAPERDMDNNIIGNPYSSLNGHDFIGKLVRLSFDYAFQRLDNTIPTDIWENTIFDAGSQNTVTKSVSRNSNTASIQLEINGHYRNQNKPNLMAALMQGLKIIIEILSKVNWTSKYIDVFKLRQSKIPVPQDKVEFSIKDASLYDGDMVVVNSFLGQSEHVHVKDSKEDDDCVYFTNRLIHNIFNQEWSVNDTGDKPTLEGAPVLISDRSGSSLSFPIGMTKALKLDHVYLSSQLYNRLLPISKDNVFIVYNRFTDSRLYFDLCEENDYHDNPPVAPPEKVMLPRYFKQLLGYNTYPFKLIRKEEFEHLHIVIENKLKKRLNIICHAVSSNTEQELKKDPLDDLILNKDEVYHNAVARIQKEGVESFVSKEVVNIRNLLNNCYRIVDKTAFYGLSEGCDEQSLRSIADLFKQFGFYDSIEILIVPKLKHEVSFYSKIKDIASLSVEKGLTRVIGKSEYLLTTCWTNETDDKNFVARLSPNMMSLLGITDNDKVVIKYGEKTETVRILANPVLTDYEIGIPANTRTLLNMYSVNDVVVVSRDMHHTFKRNSQAQTIAILGTVLAVFQVINRFWMGVILCLVFIPIIIYFSLNEERIKVK